MEVAPKDIHRPKVFDGVSFAAVSGVMASDILPNAPRERRRRNRLYPTRAIDRLGLLGEENLIPTLAKRPELRWLADEEGARWDVLAELGCIRDPRRLEAAVGWVLENRLRTKEAKTEIRRLRADKVKLPGAASE